MKPDNIKLYFSAFLFLRLIRNVHEITSTFWLVFLLLTKGSQSLRRITMRLLRSFRQKQKSCAIIVQVIPCTFLISSIGHADDSLSVLMQKIKSASAVKIAYQEIRTLELMDRPWHGSGYMYSMSPDVMIREQLLPQRVLMGINGDKMYYFKPDDNVRHQGEMDENNPLSLNFAVFKALITADEALLRKIYRVELSTDPKRWVMSLKPKQSSESDFSIVVSGLPDQQVDTISIRQADGDLSEFMLKKESAGDGIKAAIDQLFQELRGE